MGRVRINVLKRSIEPELVAKYANPHLIVPCQCHYEGQEIILDRFEKPADFCGEAWKIMDTVVCALIHGTTEPIGDHWMARPGVAIITCNDGLQPVTFKIERIDDEKRGELNANC